MSPQTRRPGQPAAPGAPTADYLTGYTAGRDNPTVDFTLRSWGRSDAWWAGYADGVRELCATSPTTRRRRRQVRRGSVIWWAWQIALPAGLFLWGVVMSVALLAWLSRGV